MGSPQGMPNTPGIGKFCFCESIMSLEWVKLGISVWKKIDIDEY